MIRRVPPWVFAAVALTQLVAVRQSPAADSVRANGVLRAIDPAGKAVILKRPTGGLDELRVSGSTTVILNGRPTTLHALKAGQPVTVTVDGKLGELTSIEVRGGAPEVLALAELNTTAWDGQPWLSPDGLTIYWASRSNTGSWIWSASRKSPDSYFEGKRRLCRGQCPTVTADGLLMVLIDGRSDGDNGLSLYASKRSSTGDPFERPRELAELRSVPHPFGPALSPDGLSLTFSGSSLQGRAYRVYQSRRASRASVWGHPGTLSVSQPANLDGSLNYPSVTADGLTMYCNLDLRDGGGKQSLRLMSWSRKSADEPFIHHEFLNLAGFDGEGFCPRYVASTNELFFFKVTEGKAGNVDLFVVKDFKPPVAPILGLNQAYPIGFAGVDLQKNSKSFGVFRGIGGEIHTRPPRSPEDFE